MMFWLLRKLSAWTWSLHRLFTSLNLGKNRSLLSHEMFFQECEKALQNRRPIVWVHVASAGELLALYPVLEKIRERGYFAFITSTSRSTLTFSNQIPGSSLLTLFPGDTPRLLEAAFGILKPDHLLLCKHDLWPNLIHVAKQSRAKVILFAPKPSSWLSSFVRKSLFEKVDLFFPETTVAKNWCLQRAGFESKVCDSFPLALAACVARIKQRNLTAYPGPERRLVLGSAYLADVERFSKISSWLRAEDWKILVVPHDVGQNHLSALSERLSRHWAVKAVETPSFPHDSRELFLLGKVGLLFEAYALSSKAWVGFGPRGLHNVLEPLSFGLSVGCAGGLDAQPLANQFSGTLLRVILKEDDLKDWLTSNLVIEKKAATPTVVPSELQEWFP